MADAAAANSAIEGEAEIDGEVACEGEVAVPTADAASDAPAESMELQPSTHDIPDAVEAAPPPGDTAAPDDAQEQSQPAAEGTVTDAEVGNTVASATADSGASSTLAELKFEVAPEGISHTSSFRLSATVDEVKAQLQVEMRIPAQNIQLLFNGFELGDANAPLDSYGLSADAPNSVELRIVYVEALPPVPATYVMPDDISVEVYFGPDIPPKVVKVAIVRAMPAKKPFLGGFRAKKSRVEYHHAASQTDRQPRPADAAASHKFHRETQTAIVIERSQQSVREAGTQMSTPHLLIDAEADKLLAPLPYFDSRQLAALRLEKAIDLQRQVRGWFARNLAARQREALELAQRQAEQSAAEAAAEAEARQKHEIERRMHPQTYEDFELLYNELEAWRLQETKRIAQAALTEPEQQAERAALLLKEQKLLQTIDKLKLQAGGENREKRIRSSLQMMAAPKRWQMSDGEVAQVHTPFTTRAKELLELYNGLRLQMLSVDERLDVLLHVKWTVKEFDCNLTRDIVELIDREADMLNRGRSESSLSGLRQRLANLFLQFVETPEFNPEAARFQKVPQELIVRPNVRPIEPSNHIRA